MILIVNADDFGMSPGVNHGIIQAHQAGVLTSTSLMVRGAAAVEAVALARQNPRLGVGLHVDLWEWECRDHEWRLRYSVVPEDDGEAIKNEILSQLEAFRALTGGNPTHIDSHQHVHRRNRNRFVAQALYGITRRLGIPLRQADPRIAYCGRFYGQSDGGESFPAAITVEALVDIILTLPEDATELACHPAAVTDMDSTYKDERLEELKSLCDPRVRTALAERGVQLLSFRDFVERQKALSQDVS